MKNNAMRLLIAFCFSFILISCSDQDVINPDPPISKSELSLCHNNLSWDEMSLANALIGEWQWVFQDCPGDSSLDSDSASSNISVEFNSDLTLTIKENGTVIESMTWEVSATPNYEFFVTTSSFNQQIGGDMLLCDDILLFGKSQLDICDHYFERK